MTEIEIGSPSEGVVVSVRESQKPDPEGWVDAEVAVKVGAWSGRYAAEFLEDDLSRFVEGLKVLSESPSTAVLSSMDGYLDLTLTRDGLGHVVVSGEAWDRPRWGAHLAFTFEIDQTYLPAMLTSAELALRQLRAG